MRSGSSSRVALCETKLSCRQAEARRRSLTAKWTPRCESQSRGFFTSVCRRVRSRTLVSSGPSPGPDVYDGRSSRFRYFAILIAGRRLQVKRCADETAFIVSLVAVGHAADTEEGWKALDLGPESVERGVTASIVRTDHGEP